MKKLIATFTISNLVLFIFGGITLHETYGNLEWALIHLSELVPLESYTWVGNSLETTYWGNIVNILIVLTMAFVLFLPTLVWIGQFKAETGTFFMKEVGVTITKLLLVVGTIVLAYLMYYGAFSAKIASLIIVISKLVVELVLITVLASLTAYKQDVEYKTA